MSFQVTLQPSGHQFQVEPDEKILEAGIKAGLSIPYSCRSGVCRSCRGKVVQGEVDFGPVHPTYLPDSDKAQGLALLCSATARSDLVVEIAELEGLAGIKPGIVPCRVVKIERPSADVAVLDLRLPMNENMRFMAGQYVDFLLKDGKRRSYSIACKPSAEGVSHLELHIRHVPGGLFTDRLFGGEVKEREVMRFEGPLGSFYLREDSDKPIIFLASGTGFAPIKAMIEHAIARGIQRPMQLYWGCRKQADLYMAALPEQWAREVPGFCYVPVLSEVSAQDGWQGRTGLVHQAVMADHPDLSGHEVYACGVPVMVDAAQRDFLAQCGLPEDAFFADSFLDESSKAAASAQ
jgi:CDP-4-dehydro-6-deoxyglucose reductase